MKQGFKFYWKKVISVVLITSLLLGIVSTNVFATTPSETIVVDGYTIEIVSNEEGETVVTTTIDGVQYTLEFNEETETHELAKKRFPVTVFGVGLGTPTEEIFELEIEEANEDYVVVDVICQNDEIVAHIDETMVEAQATLVIGAGLGAIAAALLKAFLAVTASVVILGVTYYAASSVASRLRRDQPNVHFYRARLHNNRVWIGPRFNSQSAAANHMRAGGSVWAINETRALQVSRSASPVGRASVRRVHRGANKSYFHFHPLRANGTQMPAHAWFI